VALVEAPGGRDSLPFAPSLTSEQWFHLGCEIETTSPVEARQAYLQAIELDPDLADAHLNLGRLEHEAGELGKAEAHYRDAVRCSPADPTSHFNLGVLLEDRGRREEAAYAYERALTFDPDSADAHYNLGLLLETMGRRSQAIRHLMTARQLYALSEHDE
jgi:tetratricopeptide (TPR) repeat protein